MKNSTPYTLPDNTIKIPRFSEEQGFYATARSSAIMKKIKAKDTKAEVFLRKALWQKGLRYRLHAKNVNGKPDIVFVKQKLAVFVDGDFWHGYEWEKKKQKLITNKAYWIPKIERNMQRDAEITNKLILQGWKVLRFWEHDVKKNLWECIFRITSTL